jgi:NADH-dependent peroxiredoxin subunit F
MFDLIIIGGGPSGLTAMVYAIRKHLNPLLVTLDLGGKTNYHMLMPGVSDYRVIRGIEVVDKFKAELEYLDFSRKFDEVVKVDKSENTFTVRLKGGEDLTARTVIVASGAQPQRMNVPGESEFIGKSLAYSAASYSPLMINKEVVVVGDGELALRAAAELAMVADCVHLVGPTENVYASTLGQKIIAAQHVISYHEYELVEILGDQYANAAVIKHGSQTKTLQVDCIFIEKDLIPNSEMVRGLVELDHQGRIKIDCGARTSVPGIFAAGDVTSLYAEQVLIAVGEGAKAALSAYDYLLPDL